VLDWNMIHTEPMTSGHEVCDSDVNEEKDEEGKEDNSFNAEIRMLEMS
jgi:hypothetical protein